MHDRKDFAMPAARCTAVLQRHHDSEFIREILTLLYLPTAFSHLTQNIPMVRYVGPTTTTKEVSSEHEHRCIVQFISFLTLLRGDSTKPHRFKGEVS